MRMTKKILSVIMVAAMVFGSALSCPVGAVAQGTPTSAAGDVIELTEKAKGLQRFKDVIEVTERRIVPDWLSVDYEAKKGTVKELPTRDVIDVPVNEMLIVELYSK